jgi:2-dehydropantoate 2-reductase
MLQDLLRGRRTEIDSINGAIIREGEAMGVKTPTNLVVYKLIKALERARGDSRWRGRLSL